jgi:RNA polymerase sigma-70 factor (ECF subfamily)
MRENEIKTALEQHHGDAFGWALSCCGWDRQLAEDVLQSTYLKVIDGSAVFAGRSSFKTWLYAVVRRTAAEQRRRHAIKRFVSLEVLTDRRDQKATDPCEGLARSERNARLVKALNTLPSRQREVLQLVFYHDLSIREAADVAGVSTGTARTHYERGKARLRKLLAKEQ